MKGKNVIKKTAMIPTALIAGGAGFIGSHLAEALLAKGARVIILDNFRTGKQSFVNHLLSNPNFALYDCDINEALPAEIESVDYIFHLAGLEEYSYAKEVLDLSSLMTNAFGTKHLLDLAKNSEAKLLLLSTTDVYEGRMSQLELSEYFGRNKIEENRYMLAEAKRYAEALVWEYYKKNDIDARIVRVPEIYGPRMNLVSSGNLGQFLSDIISGRDLTIYGEGTEKEFYLYVTDAINGILKAMYNDRTKGNIFSLVPDEPVTVLEVAYMVKGVADAGVKIRFEETAPEGYFKPGVLKTPDTFNLQDLKWEAKVTLREGIMKSLESLNYAPNVYSFKPAKLIEQKNAVDAAKIAAQHAAVNANNPQTEPEQNLFSLQDVKKPEPPSVMPPRAAVLIQATSNGANFIDKPKLNISLPKINVPVFASITSRLPKVTLPKIPSTITSKIAILIALLIPAFLIFIGFPLFGVYTNIKRAEASLKSIAVEGMNLNTDGVKDQSKVAYESFYSSRKSLSNLRPFFTLVGKQQNYRSLDKLLSSLIYFSKSVYTGAKAAKPLENLWEVVRPDTTAEINSSDFEDAQAQLASAKNNLSLAQADFKYVDSKYLPKKYSAYFDDYKKALDKAAEALDVSVPVYASLPNLMGASDKKRYLLLFQNSNELRPTGGFIGSYGVLTLEKGKIKDLVIDDVYNPDGQIDLRNIVSSDLPKPIETLLKEQRMHIRNANWDPDFTVSANTVEDLYFKVTGEQVDGVVAVDLYFIKNLLKATGPIFLTAYNEEVNAENIYERAEFHSEFNYQDGSDQKRSFLTILGSKLLERLFSLDRSNVASLAGAFASSLNEKHLLVYFTNDPINNLIKSYNWDGSLVSTEGDYLYLVDSNMGGTKANYYIKKKTDYIVSSLTRDGVLRGTVRIEYTHTGKDTAWPGGPYTDYVRLLSQNGAKITGATLKFNDGAAENIMDKVITSSIGKYTAFETSFVLQPQSKVLLTINYDLSPKLTLTKDKSNYSLYWQKQPGTDADEINFVMAKPFGFKVTEISGNLTQNQDSLTLHANQRSDMDLYVKLQ